VFAGRQLIGDPTTCDTICRWQLYTVDPGGGSLTRVTNADHGFRVPDWSPDGSRFVSAITFQGDFFGDELIDVITGVESDQLGGAGREASWSPDGTQIVSGFASTDGDGNILFTDPATGSLIDYLPDLGTDPAWQPVPTA
jgi:Tol biopolymer transport system component